MAGPGTITIGSFIALLLLLLIGLRAKVHETFRIVSQEHLCLSLVIWYLIH
jgi:hypothetical protein